MLVTELMATLSEQQYSQTLANKFLNFQCLFVAGQAPVSSRLTLTFLVATYKNHSCKWSSPETDPFLPPEGVRLRELPPYLKPEVAIL